MATKYTYKMRSAGNGMWDRGPAQRKNLKKKKKKKKIIGADFLKHFNLNVDLAGKANVVADALSRPPPSAASAAPASAFYSGDFASMAAVQRTDTQEIISKCKSSLKIKFFPTTGKGLACDVSQVTARPVVPVSFRQQVFSSIHNIAHLGIRASKRLISASSCGGRWAHR
jgi:hypothetical protein